MFSLRNQLPRNCQAVNATFQPKRTFINFRTPKIAELEHDAWKDTGSCYTLSATTGKFIFLNRPKQLNALNLDMVRHIYPRLKKYEEAKNCNSIVLSSAGTDNKAFCAGGDIMSLYKNGSKFMANKDDQESFDRVKTFFNEEYKLNYLTSTLNTPLITVANGITMGGGVGLSLHTQYSFATEKTLFAMPETAIGFFPDVGASHLLPRCENEVGMYLALTGDRIRGADLTHLGLAKYFTFTQNFNGLYNRLSDAHETINHVRETVEMMNVPLAELPRLSLTPHLECIARCFSQGSVEQIIEALKMETVDVEFAKKTIKTLERMSPLSLKVTFEQMRRGKTMDLGDCLKQEYRIALNMIGNSDFYTGVKSVLIDKERNVRPNWKHDSIAAVSDSEVAKYFEVPAGEKDLDLFNVSVFRGKGWSCIEKYQFNENVTDEVAHGAYAYPMFEKIQQQRNAVDEIQNTAWAFSRDKFQTMFWSYLLRQNHDVYTFNAEHLQQEFDGINEYFNDMVDNSYEFTNEFMNSLNDIKSLLIDPSKPFDKNSLSDVFSASVYNMYHTTNRLFELREQKAKLDAVLASNPKDKNALSLLEKVVAEQASLPTLPESAYDNNSMFNSFTKKINVICAKYPLAMNFFKIAKVSTQPMLEKFLPEIKHEYSPELLDLISKPLEFAQVRQELINYYNEVAALLNVPKASYHGMVTLDLGENLANIIELFSIEQGKEINPATNKPYNDLFNHWLHEIEESTQEDINNRLTSFGVFTDSLSLTNGSRELAYVLDTLRHEQSLIDGSKTPLPYNASLPQELIGDRKLTNLEKKTLYDSGVPELVLKGAETIGHGKSQLDIIGNAQRYKDALLSNVEAVKQYEANLLTPELFPVEDHIMGARMIDALKSYRQDIARINKKKSNTYVTKYNCEVDANEVIPKELEFTRFGTNSLHVFNLHDNVPKDLDVSELKPFIGQNKKDIEEYLINNPEKTELRELYTMVDTTKPVDVHGYHYSDEHIHDEMSTENRFAPLQPRVLNAREFLWYLGLDYESINMVYPGFDYFLQCPNDPLRGGDAVSKYYDGVKVFDHDDHFKLNYTDYARPMIPPRLLAKVKEHTKKVYYEDYINNRGFTDVYAK